MAPTTMGDWTVAMMEAEMIEAEMMALVEMLEIRKVQYSRSRRASRNRRGLR
jgi:hypothetical protein